MLGRTRHCFSRLSRFAPTQKPAFATYAWGTEAEDVFDDLINAPSFRLSYSDVLQARKRMEGLVAMTPLDQSPRLSQLTGTDLYLKKDNTLMTGSYKPRGAVSKLVSLTPEQKQKGVVVASSGNQAVAVSYYANQLGIPCTTVFPLNTFPTQLKSSAKYNAKVVLHGDSYAEAVAKAESLAASEGLTFIRPHNDKYVCAGYGTIAMEILQQNPYLDALIVPAGASILASLSLVVKHFNPRIEIYGVESEIQRGAANSLATLLNTNPPPAMPNIPGEGQFPFDILKQNVSDIVYVDELERASAILTVMEAEKCVVQGSGVGAVAAILSNKNLQQKFAGRSIAAICTGGNIESSLLARVIDKALVKDGRLSRIRVTVEDSVGQLARICRLLSEFRANIKEINHERAFLYRQSMGYTQYIFTVEIKGKEHIEEIVNSLKIAGYSEVIVDAQN